MKFLILFPLLSLLLFLTLSSGKSRKVAFWVSLILFFDPGGFFSGYLDGNILWRVKYYDVFFAFMLLAYALEGQIKIIVDNVNKDYNKIFRYLLFITLYFLIITGILMPLLKGYPDFPFFIQKNRQYFYALPLFIMTYTYSCTSIRIFYRILITFSVIILISYMLTLLTPIKIVPAYTLTRYGEADRIIMISYSLIHWVLPMGIVFLALGKKNKLPYGNHLMSAFILMVITIFLTLTRRELIRIIFMILVIPFLISKINRSLYINKYSKFIVPASGIVLIMVLIFPNYIDLTIRTINDAFHIVVTGKDTQGVEDYRITGTGDLKIVKDIINKNPLFGIGFYPAQWSEIMVMKSAGDKLGLALDAASEVPVYGALMTLGIIGLLIPLFLYWHLFKIWRKVYQILRDNFPGFINYPVELLIITTLSYFLLAKVTVDVYGLFGEFYSPYSFTGFVVILGMWLGIFQRFRIILSPGKY